MAGVVEGLSGYRRLGVDNYYTDLASFGPVDTEMKGVSFGDYTT